MDTNDLAPGVVGTNTGLYNPDLLIQNGFSAPGNYELSAKMYANDDDLTGLVWNYQDPNNYFRVGLRQQPASGNLGGTEGLSVQKVVNGVITQLQPTAPGVGVPAITQEMISNRTAFDVKVAVNGSNYSVSFNGAELASGVDADLASGRKIGISSWAQNTDVTVSTTAVETPYWGTEVESISVKQGATTLYNSTFEARPSKWRQMVMTNSAGINGLSVDQTREVLGNFGNDVNDPWIHQVSNGFQYATATAPNVDFIGPGVVIDEAGSSAFSNYEMKVRMGAVDNDGYGLLLRVQDDSNFYRVNFANEAMGTNGQRAPRGLSVQKVQNGVWTEIYRDDQTTPLFLPPTGAAGANPATGLAMFDVAVGMVGNSMKVQVRNQSGDVINYPLITDNSGSPLLTGSVGLTTWGTNDVFYMGYGGQATPLLSAISAFTELDATVNRATGAITLTNNGGAPVGIKGITIKSAGGGLNPVTWTPVATLYDEAPGNGSVDPDDPWTVTSSTSLQLSEAEQSGGNGGTIGVGQTVNLGNAWVKSQIEDVVLEVQLANGSLSVAEVAFSGGPNAGNPFARSDLNTDGVLNAADWPLFIPNMLSDMSALTNVAAALKGDLDLDGDNDVTDFSLFKADYDLVNGVGAFEAMLASVPEPSTLSLMVGGFVALAARTRRRIRVSALSSGAIAVGSAATALATPADLTTYTTESFAPAATFGAPVWVTTPSTASLNSNADATVLLSPDSALNKRYIGRVTPGADDDVIGFVMGFDPGDGFPGSTADYLLLDWKGVTQAFDFADATLQFFHHDQTLTGTMPVGLALSRVTGSPTADEMWQHLDLPENSTGGVAELGRGATLGSTAYNRAGGSHLVDITYTPTRITVAIDGVQQFDLAGSFPDGRFGLYSAFQGPTATFSNFEVLPATGFTGLSLTVDRTSGAVSLRNTGTVPVQLDYYQIDSALNSLNKAGWNSLSDQNFQSMGPGNGQSWDEAGGSDAGSLAEAFLLTNSSIAANATISLGTAYNNAINGEDLTFNYRLPSGLILPGVVNYIGEAPGGQPGDYDGDSDVDGADFLVWQRAYGAVGSNPADGNNDNVVNGDDLTVWKNNFGASGAVGAAAAVPEPATAALLAGGLAALALRRRSI